MTIPTDSVEISQNAPKQSGGIRLKWAAVPGVTCAGCVHEHREDCEHVDFPDGKTCLDKFHEDTRNWILVEDKA